MRFNDWLRGDFFFLFLQCSARLWHALLAPPDCQTTARRGVKARAYGSMSHSAQPSCSCCSSHREALSGAPQKNTR